MRLTRIHTICIFYLSIFTFFSCEKEINFTGNHSLISLDLSYGNDSKNKMDIFLPKNRNKKTKTLIFIHGGGWISGDKSCFMDLAKCFLDAGIASVSINYRYADVSKGIDYNVILNDINNAIIFLKTKSKDFDCPFDNITLFGTSAGGHLALLYAYKYNNIANVISIAGPTDLNDKEFLLNDDIKNLVANLTGNDLFFKKFDASPLIYVNNTTTYLYHGKSDPIVPYNQSKKLYNKIMPLNNKNKLMIFENCGHELTQENLQLVIKEIIQLINNTSTYQIHYEFDIANFTNNPYSL